MRSHGYLRRRGLQARHRHWAELAKAVERHGASVRAVGHDGQHDAIRLPGLFSEMLTDQRIPTAELRQIRRHRDPDNPERAHPWLRGYQIAVDQGHGLDAVAILQEQNALHLHDTRAQAIGEMVEEWDRWRRGHAPTESALIVHGPNSDVDLVNELAQRKRLDSGELGEHAIRAVDRDYLLRPGDVVAIRNAAYTFQALPGEPRPKRIENGQTAIIESVDPERDTLTLLLREPGAQPRLVEVDKARLRMEHATGERAAAVRLNYALHTFPAQGATVHGTATLAGHWSQAKQETYVGDTRAIYRHSVHIAREDLGTNGTDEDRIARYATRISANRQRHASIRQTLDSTQRLAVDLPERQPLPPVADVARALGPRDPSREVSAFRDACRQQPARVLEQLERALSDPPEHLIRALGPPPDEQIARERWEREAQRLQALQPHAHTVERVAPPRPSATDPVPSRHAPASPPAPAQRSGPTIRR